MPRLSPPVIEFLSHLVDELKKPKSLDFTQDELSDTFLVAVKGLPKCHMKEELLRHTAACISHLKTGLDGKFSSFPVPRKMRWNLLIAGGVKKALAQLQASDIAEYGALLLTKPGKSESRQVLIDYLQKAVPGTEGRVIAAALKSFTTMSLRIPVTNTLSALWYFLNERLSTAASVTSELAAVADSLERALQCIHMEQDTALASLSGRSVKTSSHYADLMAACLSWLIDAHILLCNKEEDVKSNITAFLATVLSRHTHHLLDAVLQVSVPPCTEDSFDFLLPAIRWSCEQCRSVQTPPDFIKFLVCCRIGLKLSESSTSSSHAKLPATFREIGLSVRPPADLPHWMQNNCPSTLLQMLAINGQWSASQLCLHLLLHADEGAVDYLLDVVTEQDEGESRGEQQGESGGSRLAADTSSNDKQQQSSTGAASDGLFFVDSAGSEQAKHDQTEWIDQPDIDTHLDDDMFDDESDGDSEGAEPMDVQDAPSSEVCLTEEEEESTLAAHAKSVPKITKTGGSSPIKATQPSKASPRKHVPQATTSVSSPIKATRATAASASPAKTRQSRSHASATAMTSTAMPRDSDIAIVGESPAKSPLRSQPSKRSHSQSPAKANTDVQIVSSASSTPRRRSSRLAHPSPVVDLTGGVSSPSKRKRTDDVVELSESPLVESRSARKRKSPVKSS